MGKSHFSHHWYRVANLKPALRNHVEIHRQRMRGKTWFIIQDAQSGKYFRVSPATRAMLLRLDGSETIDTIWSEEGQKLGELQPTQAEVIQLIAQLYRADLIRGDVPPFMAEFIDRSDKTARQNLLVRYKNPLALRFPLVDPDSFFEKGLPFVRLLFSRWGVIFWALLLVLGSLLATMHWGELTNNLSDRVLSANNVLLLLLLYPVIKVLHELGHGFTVKSLGGEVHDIGLMLLVFMPVPYVDASSSAVLKNRWHRAAVGAAGIMVESGLAVIALFVWLAAEPGIVRAGAFNVMMIGGLSTVLFNGNPLLRFDGYYVLSDILNIPNLGARSNKYLLYLIQHYLFGMREVESVATSKGEARWFIVYGISAFVYRMIIMVAIALFVATQFFFIGILLAALAVLNAVVLPLFKGIKYLFSAHELGQNRRRAKLVSFGAVATLGLLLFVIPARHVTESQGVFSLGEGGAVINTAAGFVAELPLESGTLVEVGTTLLLLEDEELDTQVRSLGAELREFQNSFAAVNLFDQVQANILKEQIARTEATLAHYLSRQEGLTIKARRAGIFILPSSTDLLGRYVSEGKTIAYVVPVQVREAQVVVSSDRSSLVSDDTQSVEVRVEGAIDQLIEAKILRQAPSALISLPSAVLSSEGGGSVAVNPQKDGQLEPLQKHYRFDIELLSEPEQAPVNARVHVHFVHSDKPIGLQWIRTARQTFMSLFNV
ncbi:zinc metalloprotease [Marinobacter orientalis]|uniref:Peptidase M50 n=1 Tax=Marinobacter orientalis TaxID=1928859 RepID=A0A7Y0REX6_9GAMM|nr:peptidase M50 [Marinobacter orientalis]NMT65002.1 peptidase M50 [Marinobacter orientalis]TGX48107.1 peptidase M50 [Marinobacter orientalis]